MYHFYKWYYLFQTFNCLLHKIESTVLRRNRHRQMCPLSSAPYRRAQFFVHQLPRKSIRRFENSLNYKNKTKRRVFINYGIDFISFSWSTHV